MAVHTLILSLDLGASLTKGFVTILKDGKRQIGSIKMDSDVVTTDKKVAEKLKSLDSTSPENNAWITKQARYTKKVTVVGTLAKRIGDFRVVQIERVKYEYAVEKVLAAVGAIIKKYGLERGGFEVAMNLVLPSDESEGKESIKKNLAKAIERYQFCGEVIEGKLIGFNCFPEGMGGILYRAKEENFITEKKLAVVMLGHRNSSCLILDKGAIGSQKTERYGYFDFLTAFKEQNLGQRISELEEMIPLIEEDESNEDLIFRSLVKAERKANQNRELNKLHESYRETKEAFWKKLYNWLDVHIPTVTDEILILGGGARHFKKEIIYAFGYTKLYWGKEAVEELGNLMPEIFKEDKILAQRYIDIYGTHKINQ